MPKMQTKFPLFHRLRDDRASMTIFALGLLVGMFSLGGIALDSMHYENKRLATQDAMDRCALMAAIAQNRIDGGASTGITAEDVANDCMEKSSVGSAGLNTPAITTLNSERQVTLSGNYTFNALNPVEGEPTSRSFAIGSSSKQKLPNLELTIAVDINHSVFWNFFKAPLKTFLNTIAAPDTGNKMTVNIIPFNKNVFLGPTTLAQMGTKNEPPFTTKSTRTCLVLPEDADDELGFDMQAADYSWSWPVYFRDLYKEYDYTLNSYPLLTGQTINTVHGDAYVETVHYLNNGSTGQIAALTGNQAWANCAYPISTNNIALLGAQVQRPVSLTTPSPINSKIDEIVPVTHSDVSTSNSVEALRWSLSAMDPSLQALFATKSAEGSAAAAAADRPLAYDEEDTLKVLIFVTNNVFRVPSDGVLTGLAAKDSTVPLVREIRPEFLDGTEPMPDIWRTPDVETTSRSIRYSIFHEDAPDPAKPYWVTRDRAQTTETGKAHWAAAPYQYPDGGAPVRQTWNQIFSKMTLGYLIRELYMLPMSKAGVLPNNEDYHADTLMDKFTYIATQEADLRDQFEDLCDKAKDEGVLIYTLIGNGAVTRTVKNANDTAHNNYATPALQTYKNCATSPAHNFTVGNAATVKSTLRLIASNIAQLTLIQ